MRLPPAGLLFIIRAPWHGKSLDDVDRKGGSMIAVNVSPSPAIEILRPYDS